MKALSIKQPWAWAILRKEKDIENRTWSTKYRGLFKIHASLIPDVKAERDLYHEWLEAFEKKDPAASLGAIVGTARVVDVVEHSSSDWFFGPYGFVLTNAIELEEAVIAKGKLGFWETK